MEAKARTPWASWIVKDEEYKLKLSTSVITKLEEKYKVNLLETLASDTMPPLGVMLDVAHGALQKYHHGIKKDDVVEMFDEYIEEGGSQLGFFTEVYIPIFTASGFFTPTQSNTMEKNLEEKREELL